MSKPSPYLYTVVCPHCHWTCYRSDVIGAGWRCTYCKKHMFETPSSKGALLQPINYTALSIVAAMQQNFDEENTADWDRVFVDNIHNLCEELNSIYRWYQLGRYFEDGTKEVYMTVLAFGYKSKTVFYGRTEVMVVNQERSWEVVKDWEVVQ